MAKSLKGKYIFNKILRYGETQISKSFILKYLKSEEDSKKFGIIASNKFSKKAVVQNQARRIFKEAIDKNLKSFPDGYQYIFIPKKNILDQSGKINASVERISSEIDSLLSEVAFA